MPKPVLCPTPCIKHARQELCGCSAFQASALLFAHTLIWPDIPGKGRRRQFQACFGRSPALRMQRHIPTCHDHQRGPISICRSKGKRNWCWEQLECLQAYELSTSCRCECFCLSLQQCLQGAPLSLQVVPVCSSVIRSEPQLRNAPLAHLSTASQNFCRSAMA